MRTFIATTLTAMTLALGAQASHGPDQLARSLGVEPDLYSLSQLALLKSLQEDGNAAFRIGMVLKHPEGAGGDRITDHRTGLDPNTAGWVSIALSLGVEPGQYTPAQLLLLRSAMEDGDQTLVALIKSGEVIHSGTDRGQVSPGEAQLARSLGLEPGLYSLSQLAQLKSSNGDTENAARDRQILENPAFE